MSPDHWYHSGRIPFCKHCLVWQRHPIIWPMAEQFGVGSGADSKVNTCPCCLAAYLWTIFLIWLKSSSWCEWIAGWSLFPLMQWCMYAHHLPSGWATFTLPVAGLVAIIWGHSWSVVTYELSKCDAREHGFVDKSEKDKGKHFVQPHSLPDTPTQHTHTTHPHILTLLPHLICALHGPDTLHMAVSCIWKQCTCIWKMAVRGVCFNLWCCLPVVAHTLFQARKDTSPSYIRAIIWYVKHSYMLYNFQAMHGTKKEGRKEKKEKEDWWRKAKFLLLFFSSLKNIRKTLGEPFIEQ